MQDRLDFVIYSDGACHPNPGLMAIGVTIRDIEGKEVATISELIGEGTCNIAEYRAAIAGVEKAKALGGKVVELRSDSEVLVRQVNADGGYTVKSKKLLPLWIQLCGLLQSFTKATVLHVPRADNTRADGLAEYAFEQATEPTGAESEKTTPSPMGYERFEK